MFASGHIHPADCAIPANVHGFVPVDLIRARGRSIDHCAANRVTCNGRECRRVSFAFILLFNDFVVGDFLGDILAGDFLVVALATVAAGVDETVIEQEGIETVVEESPMFVSSLLVGVVAKDTAGLPASVCSK